jgi:hypothetical protein
LCLGRVVRLITTYCALLKLRDYFCQRHSVSGPEEIEKLLETKMKRNRRQIYISDFSLSLRRDLNFIRYGDRVPGINRLEIANFNARTIVQSGHRYVVNGGHGFDGDSLSFETVVANNSEIDLSVGGLCFLKDALPIDIPTGEDGGRISCDGEQNRPSVNMRQADAISGR